MSEISHAGGSVTPQQSSKAAWSTRKLVLLALFTALSLILSFIEAPIFPAAPFLKYDPSAVIAGFAACGFGVGAGLSALGPARGRCLGCYPWPHHG